MTKPKPRGKALATQTVTLTLRNLHDLLKPVLPHCDYGQTLPVLGCVSFATNGEWLTATATDRYTIGVTRTPVPAGTAFNCLIQAVELKSMLSMFKPKRGDAGESVTMTVDGPLVRVVGASAMFAEASVAYSLYEGEYPKVKSILADADKPGEPDMFGLNAAFLTKFIAAQRLNQPVILSRPSPNKPLFLRSHNFLGAIMPVWGATGQSHDVIPAAEWAESMGYVADEPKAVSA